MNEINFNRYVKSGSAHELWLTLKEQGYVDEDKGVSVKDSGRAEGLTLISPYNDILENPVFHYLMDVRKFRDNFDSYIDPDIVNELWHEDYKIVMKEYFNYSAIIPVSENRNYKCNSDDTKFLEYFLNDTGKAGIYEWDKFPDAVVEPVIDVIKPTIDLNRILTLYEAELFEMFLRGKESNKK